MILCICGGFELLGLFALFGWVVRKIRNMRKKHDTGECCDLEHVAPDNPKEDKMLGVCMCCTMDMYSEHVHEDDLDRLRMGREVECIMCQEGDDGGL